MRVHDPYLDHWFELEQQDVYPAPGHSWSRFFHNQEGLKDIRIQEDLGKALSHAEAVIWRCRTNSTSVSNLIRS